MIRIVGDSSLDLTEEFHHGEFVAKVPFRIMLDGVEWRDTPDIDMEAFRKAMSEAKHFQTACGSPQEFYDIYDGEGDVFALTITSKLSGSYNAAVLGKQLYQQDYPDKKIHVVDTLSTSTAAALIYMKIRELIDKKSALRKYEMKRRLLPKACAHSLSRRVWRIFEKQEGSAILPAS